MVVLVYSSRVRYLLLPDKSYPIRCIHLFCSVSATTVSSVEQLNHQIIKVSNTVADI